MFYESMHFDGGSGSASPTTLHPRQSNSGGGNGDRVSGATSGRSDDHAEGGGLGNLAQEIQSRCQLGDRYVFEGRLRISTIDRPEGFKEKQAELTLSKIHNLSGEEYQSTETAAPDAGRSYAPRSIQSAPRAVQAATQAAASGSTTNSPTRSAPAAGAAKAEPDYDDIPF